MTHEVIVNGKKLTTLGGKKLAVPTKALAEAIVTEWEAHGKFIPSNMPMTALATTAIDRAAEELVEMMMTYLDTDALCYRATSSERLARMQTEQWNPVLDWAASTLGEKWQITDGVMPIEQPAALHERVRDYLRTSDSMRLAAVFVMASVFSSLALAIAVMEKHIEAEAALELSRLEEEFQAEAWGRDDEEKQRKQRLQAEILSVKRFLRLLEA